MFETFVGTRSGVYQLTDRGVEPLGLESERISALHGCRDEGAVSLLAGSYEHGMFRGEDGGRVWRAIDDAGLTAPCFRTIEPDPLDRSAILAGAEPGRIFRSHDGGRRWRELEGVRRVEGYERWYLPYSPRAGAVRNVWSPPGREGRLLASVEVGGLLRSEDGGESWACEMVLDDEDVHYVTGHPRDADLLYTALGYATLTYRGQPNASGRFGGVARSRDGGRSWQKVETDYTRAVIVPPSRPDLVLAGPAPHVGREGRIVVSSDAGESWQPAGQGLETPMDDMVELFVAAPDDSIWAICSGGRLLRAEAGEWGWESRLPTELQAQSLAFV